MSFTHRLRALRSKPAGEIARRAAQLSRRFVANELLDFADTVRLQRDPMVPRRNAFWTGNGDYIKAGDLFLSYFIELGGLRTHHRVLDVGSGQGRMARPLTGYLGPDGSYEGLEIVKAGVDWCRERITSRHPRFRFTHADVWNGRYNPRGRFQSREYRFPYPDADFDFAILTSVFTHLRPHEVEHYIRELARVMKPGGRVFGTWYLLDDFALQQAAAGKVVVGGTAVRFPVADGPARYGWAENPEAIVGFDLEWVRQQWTAAGFEVPERPLFGDWNQRPDHLGFQDTLIVTRR
jgi:SAM-dependent methyltransferase